ncbi:MAG: hypothetical protein K1X79_04015 [Oligoflexia bacterium]|nr:hypothetical protein [Oligoflexia bacterium]
MDSEFQYLRPIQTLSRFLHAFAHEMRTPLSVLSNELYCMSAGVVGDGLKPAQQACQLLSAKLREVSSSIPHEVTLQSLSLAELLCELEKHFSMEILGARPVGGVYSSYSPALLPALIKALQVLGIEGSICRLCVGPSVIELTWGQANFSTKPFSALSEYALQHAYARVVEASLLDAMLWAHRATLEASSGFLCMCIPMDDK